MTAKQSNTPEATKRQSVQKSKPTAADIAAKEWAVEQAAKMPALRPEQLKRIGAIIGAVPPATDQD